MATSHRPASEQRGGPLEEVLEAERAGASTVDAARRDAEEWLAHEKLAIQRAAEADLAAIEAAHQADLIAARRDADARAAAVIASAESEAAALHALTDQDLRPIVARHLRCLLPRGAP
jgi:hypothetical protein